MRYVLTVILTLGCPTWLAAAGTPYPPSDGARGMCGAMGVVTFIPEHWKGAKGRVVENPDGPETWWVDTDGIAPGVAGCHLELTKAGKRAGRSFGEACLNQELLVETNPGEGVKHSHVNDVGHPDTFNCDLWCLGNGASGGVCKTVVEAEDKRCKGLKSAKCACAE